MSLENELGLKKGFQSVSHEALLNVYHTASRIRKKAAEFFRDSPLTDVQFNLMVLLSDHADETGGLTQVQLSRMMLVNRPNITSLIDRMERTRLVVRTPAAGDRRYNLVRLTPHGRKLLSKVEDTYAREVRKIMGALKKSEQKTLIEMLERVRERLNT